MPKIRSSKAGGIVGGFTEGSIIFADEDGALAEDNDNLFWDNTNKRMGIGIANPEFKLHLFSSSETEPSVFAYQNETDTVSTFMRFDRAAAGPALLTANRNIVRIVGRQWDGSAYRTSAEISFRSGVTPDTLDSPGRIHMFTTPEGSTALVERLKILETGNVIFNDTGVDSDFTIEAVGVTDAFFVQGSDGQITLGALTAGFVKSSAGGVLSVQSEIDISDDTNLAVSSPITLVDDTVGLDESAVDHGSLGGLSDDDHTIYILADGSRPLTSSWDVGSFSLRGLMFQSDIATGDPPLLVTSTTMVDNLNADLLDDQEGSYYLDSDNFTGTEWTDLTDSGATTLHKHDHGGLDGLSDDDHTIYLLATGARTGASSSIQPFTNGIRLTAKAGSTTDGDTWNDSTQKALQTYVDSMEQSLVGCIFTQTANKAVGSTTTETTIVGTGVGITTLPANSAIVGKTIRVTTHGFYNARGVGETLTIKGKLGTTIIINTVAIATGAATTQEFTIVSDYTVRSVGATGTVFGQGVTNLYLTGNKTTPIQMVNTGTTTVDTTTSQLINFTAQWSVAHSTNTITTTNMTIEILN